MKPPTELTPDELRIEVARLLGIKVVRLDNEGQQSSDGNGVLYGDHKPLPNYPASLDACAELRKHVESLGLHGQFMYHLRELVKAEYQINGAATWYMVDASAKNTCIAFLQTMRQENHEH
jgi:hypothetical protein